MSRSQPVPPPRNQPLGVLLVDDEDSTVRLLEQHLTAAGYEVITAVNGVEAMQVLLTDGPPIVITDWVMPDMDGLELCRTIRAHEAIPFAYIIMMSAYQTTEEKLVQALHAGADDYVSKPVKVRELLARLRAVERIVHLQGELDARNREVHRYNAEMEITNTKLAQANAELNRMATTDELTGLMNRREAMARLLQEWSAAERHGHALTIIAVDIDRFKSCNDAYGHAAGDAVLKETARVLRVAARREESVCRMGGEEFLILCPHATEAMAAVGAERIRQAVEANVVRFADMTLRATISLGVAQRRSTMNCPDDLLRAGDDALYAAKDAGRNTVWLASEERPSAEDSFDSVAATLSACAAPPGMAETPFLTDSERVSGGVRPGKVLVVDDDESTRKLCRKFLERVGHEVLEAADGAGALAIVERDTPDVIIMDAVMPEMDGLQCTRTLKANPAFSTLPVILSSARSDATDIVAGLEAGADECLYKPINPKELVLRVKTMIRLSRELARSNAIRGEQSRALGILLEFSRDIAAVDSLDEILKSTVATAAALTCSPRVCILLPEGADPAQLRVRESLGFDPEAVAGIRIPIGAPVSGEVFQSGTSVVVTTAVAAASHAGDADAAILSGLPNAALSLCAPDGPVGVLTITGQPRGEPFSSVNLEYLDLICNLAAAAIHEHLTRRDRDEARHSIVLAMATLAERRDADTGKHVERVSRFCALLACELRSIARFRRVITREYLHDLKRAVPLHDIGKVAVPDRILLKPGPLTAEETAVMRSHTAVGAKTLRPVIERVPDVTFLTMAEEIAASHHEWYNGEGYPRGLSGEAIPLAARIVAVADVYDAVTTRRVYKEAMSHEEAVAIIEELSGRQFDPDVVLAFRKCEAQFKRLAIELADDPTPLPDRLDPTRSDAALAGACLPACALHADRPAEQVVPP